VVVTLDDDDDDDSWTLFDCSQRRVDDYYQHFAVVEVSSLKWKWK